MSRPSHPSHISRPQERLAAWGAATMMTLVMLAGIGVLAETQSAADAVVQPAAQQVQQVQQVLIVGQRAPRS